MVAEKVSGADVAAFLADVSQDPVRYVKSILGHTTWDKQREILTAISENPRVAVKACHASSKTYSAAEAALWWVTNFDDGVVITTAPIFKQVRLVMWGEIRRMIREDSMIDYPKLNQTELKISDDNFIIGLSTSEGVNLQGYHGKILVILDEAVGIANDIFEAIEGIRAGGDVRMLALGNPTVPGGTFYDAFQGKAYNWKTITISAFDCPNLKRVEPRVQADPEWETPGITDPYHRDQLATLLEMEQEELEDNPWPMLITRDWVVEKWHEWGIPNNPLWYSRVLGQFPPQADNALINMEWVERSRLTQEDYDPQNGVPLEVGVDVAGPGEDETVVIIRQGNTIVDWRAWKDPNPNYLLLEFLTPYAHKISKIKVDSNGIGWGMFLFLQERYLNEFPGIQILGVNVGAGAFERHRFMNLKAELYWHLREVMSAAPIANMTDETLQGQLLALLYEIRPDGRTKIESKEDMRDRGVPSPDRAEALMLAFAPVEAPLVDEEYLYEDEVHISPV